MNAHENKVKLLADYRRILADRSAEGIAPDVLACKNCRFSVKQRTDPSSIAQHLVCRWGPPQMTMLPMQQGLVINTQFPIVKPEWWCWRFESVPNADDFELPKG